MSVTGNLPTYFMPDGYHIESSPRARQTIITKESVRLTWMKCPFEHFVVNYGNDDNDYCY